MSVYVLVGLQSVGIFVTYIVSLLTLTSWDVLLHTTLWGHWSVVMMWVVKTYGWNCGRSARSWYLSGKFLANNLQMTFRTTSCHSLYRRMLSALGQLLWTRSSVCLSPQSWHQLDRPSLFLHTARFALCGSLSCTAFMANFNSSGGSFCTTTLWFHWPWDKLESYGIWEDSLQNHLTGRRQKVLINGSCGIHLKASGERCSARIYPGSTSF